MSFLRVSLLLIVKFYYLVQGTLFCQSEFFLETNVWILRGGQYNFRSSGSSSYIISASVRLQTTSTIVPSGLQKAQLSIVQPIHPSTAAGTDFGVIVTPSRTAPGCMNLLKCPIYQYEL